MSPKIVGWDDKRKLKGAKRLVIETIIKTFQPDEGKLYALSPVAGFSLNLLHIRRLEKLKRPFGVDRLTKWWAGIRFLQIGQGLVAGPTFDRSRGELAEGLRRSSSSSSTLHSEHERQSSMMPSNSFGVLRPKCSHPLTGATGNSDTGGRYVKSAA